METGDKLFYMLGEIFKIRFTMHIVDHGLVRFTCTNINHLIDLSSCIREHFNHIA
jgi:hypothetical protein